MSDYDFSAIPFDDVVALGQRTLRYRKLFTVSWLLNRFCNYSCSYCWPHGRSNVKDFAPIDVCLKTIDEIKRQARENGFEDFHFSFSGGEPTVHPQFLEIIEHLSTDSDASGGTAIHMTSNCSRNFSWFEKFVAISSTFNKVAITASLHLEHVNSPQKIKDFTDKLLLCQQNSIIVLINLVMVQQNFNQLLEIATDLHSAGINVTLKPQSNYNASQIVQGYSAEQLLIMQTGLPAVAAVARKARVTRTVDEMPPLPNDVPKGFMVELVDKNKKIWYLDQAERLNAFQFNKFAGWSCNAGFQGIVIKAPSGRVHRSYSCQDEKLGSIYDGFTIFKGPAVCISPTCVSSADSKIPKTKYDIKPVTFEDVLPFWKLLWPERDSIAPASSMVLLGGTDMSVYQNTTTFFGAFFNGKLVGVNSGVKVGGTYRSRGLYVMPEFRQQGISTLLFDALFLQARKEDISTVWSFPRKQAIAAYNKAGFVSVSPWEMTQFGENCYVTVQLT